MRAIRNRGLRWSIWGAIILALLSIVLGGLFTALIALAEQIVPPDAGAGYWAALLLRSTLIWGIGALPFGAILGMFASLIWRDEAA
jgi:polyferredoxin